MLEGNSEKRLPTAELARMAGIEAKRVFRLQTGQNWTWADAPSDYAEHCASCHGANLEGEPSWKSRKPSGRMPAPPHSEQGHTWHHTDTHLFELTKFGLKKFAGEDYESDMPAYEGVLSDEEIVAVLSYIKSTWPTEIREYHDHLNKQATKSQDN